MPQYLVIKERWAFSAAYKKGRSRVHPALVTYVRKNRYGRPRVGITAGKKVGGAVQRNRCRRLIREAYRTLVPSVSGGWDIIFVARSRMLPMKSTQVLPVMREHLQTLGVLL